MDSKTSQIMCELSTADATKQMSEWADLQSSIEEVVSFETGVRLYFPISLRKQVINLAEREAACCRFLNMSHQVVDNTFLLIVSSDNPAAMPVLSLLVGEKLS